MMTSVRRKPFKPGQAVLVRQLWRGKVWSARPEIVVRDTSELLVLFISPGIVLKEPEILENGHHTSIANRMLDQWRFVDIPWQGNTGRLRLTIPGEPHSVLIFWNAGYISQNAWYINFEDPLYRTSRGFDYTDQILDIVLEPDLKTWYWKDEDELQEAIVLGLVSPEKAGTMRAEGEKVVGMLQSGTSVFNGWENWRPDPSWHVPTLPDRWDIV